MPEPLRAIDSNVVLCYLLRDNIEQWEKATSLIDSDQPLGLTPVTLAEVAWTLTGATLSARAAHRGSAAHGINSP